MRSSPPKEDKTGSWKWDLAHDPVSYPIKGDVKGVEDKDRGDKDRSREDAIGTGITGPGEGHPIGGAIDAIKGNKANNSNTKNNLASLLI